MIELVTYHTWQMVRGGRSSAIRTALVKRGTKWLQVVAMDATPDGGLKVWKVPVADEAYMTPLLRKGKPYPMARALKRFRSLGATHGITKAAKKILKEAANENKTAKTDAASTGDNA